MYLHAAPTLMWALLRRHLLRRRFNSLIDRKTDFEWPHHSGAKPSRLTELTLYANVLNLDSIVTLGQWASFDVIRPECIRTQKQRVMLPYCEGGASGRSRVEAIVLEESPMSGEID